MYLYEILPLETRVDGKSDWRLEYSFPLYWTSRNIDEVTERNEPRIQIIPEKLNLKWFLLNGTTINNVMYYQ